MTYKEYLSSPYMTTWAGKTYSKISRKLITFRDIINDYINCGISLEKYVKSIDRSISTGSESTRYMALKEIFKDIDIKNGDRFVDVGCGKGRVLAYVHSAAKDCEVTGIEFNTPVADYAKKWADKKKNVNIINGNAFDINCDDYDIFYFNRPLMEETFVQFAEKMNRELKHPATVICYADSYMSKHLKDLPHWERVKRGVLYKKGIWIYSYYPQLYSILKFNPAK